MDKNKIALCREDRIMSVVVNTIMIILVLCIAFPLVYVVSCSFSSGTAVSEGKVLFWPVDFSLIGYKLVFSYRLVWSGYANTIFITVVGTALSMILTILAAYPLSRKNFQGRNIYLFIFMFTMFFSGGIIPSYLLMVKLKLNGRLWAVVLNGALSISNMIIMRTFFANSVPGELLDAARIDGITDFKYLFKILLPLSKAVIAVIVLYYAVGRWNSYFSAMIYLRDRNLYPLQLVLRDVLNVSNIDLSQVTDESILAELRRASDTMKYALIIVSSVPVLVAYPFVMKFFEKGVMIGSVKG